MTWLAIAADAAAAADADAITGAHVDACRKAARDRFHAQRLTPFSDHHALLVEAITHLTTPGGAAVQSGTVYDVYEQFCHVVECPQVTRRQRSKFFTQLELRGLLDVDHAYGGVDGRTLYLQLPPFEEL